MASGGRDSESALTADGGPPTPSNGRGPSAPDIPQPPYPMHPMSMITHEMLVPTMRCRGPECCMNGSRGPMNFNPHPYARCQTRHYRPDLDDPVLLMTREEEDVSDKFSETELNQVVEKKYLSFVANSCDESASWRRLARKLKLDSPSVLYLESNYSLSIHLFIYNILLTWKSRHPEARVRELIKVLCESKLQKPALELKRYFSSIHWPDGE